MPTARNARYDFYVAEDEGGILLSVKGRGAVRLALGIVLLFPAGLVGFLGLLALGSHRPQDGPVALAVAAALGLLAYFLTNSRSTTQIIITPKAIIAGGETYDLDHVTAFSQGGPRTGGVVAIGGLYAGAAMAGQQMNQMLYLVYGSREVKLLQGQTPASIALIYSVIVGYLLSTGRKYGEANTNDIANYKAAVQRGVPPGAKPFVIPRSVKIGAIFLVVVIGLAQVVGHFVAPHFENGSAMTEFDRRAAANRTLDGKHYIVETNYFLYDAPTRMGTPARYVFLKGSCVRSLRSDGDLWVEFDLDTPDGKQRLYARSDPLATPKGGACKPTANPARKRVPQDGND